jgi:hypothetical protein
MQQSRIAVPAMLLTAAALIGFGIWALGGVDLGARGEHERGERHHRAEHALPGDSGSLAHRLDRPASARNGWLGDGDRDGD